MLVLTRKQGEQILVGDEIVITIVRISGNQIRVGIEAPPQVRVIRPESSGDEIRYSPKPVKG